MNTKITKSQNTKVALQKIKTFLNLTDLPEELIISTMTVNCGLEAIFNIENIGTYMKLSKGKIVTIKTGDGPTGFRTLVEKKTKAKKKKKVRRVFYNQASFKILSKYKKNGNPVDVKLFKNGSITLTGCDGLETCVDILNTLCEELKKVRAILDPITNNKIILKPFVDNPNKLNLEDISSLKIRMINTNFRIGFEIDRDQLYQVLLDENIECIYEPCVHACVNIKYYHNGTEKVSIFVFASGSIIITGGKNKDQVVAAFNFITNKLFDNYKEIIKTNLDDILKCEGIDVNNSSDMDKLSNGLLAISL
jgi:TATA-box binding protein (TBP) (component of TFIID and TFIIIB)